MAGRLEHAIKHSEKFTQIKGYVYFVQCNEFTKIGFAADVQQRFCNLQIGNPYQLRLLRTIASDNPVEIEEEIHSRLEKYHVRGEWFQIPLDVLADLLEEVF